MELEKTIEKQSAGSLIRIESIDKNNKDILRKLYMIDKKLFHDKWAGDVIYTMLEDYECYVLFDGDNLIGYCYISPLSEERCEIANFAIDDIYQGKGYGTLFMQEIIRKRKNTRITLQVDMGNKIAISLYTRMGFKTIKEIRGQYLMELIPEMKI